MFGQYRKSSYLCCIGWKPLCGPKATHTDVKDVFKRLSCWNINFAKVTTITDRATKRLRGASSRRAGIGGIPPMRLFRYFRAGVGYALVAYPDG